MQDARSRGRSALNEWRESQPKNFFDNHHLESVLRRHWSKAQWQAHRPTLEHYGLISAGPLDEAAIINNRVHNLPLLERYSDLGDRIESIEHHPAYHACGKAIYEDGKVIAAYKEEEPNLLAQALFYISSHVGEAGHNCPVACTAGVVKACAPKEAPSFKRPISPGYSPTTTSTVSMAHSFSPKFKAAPM